MLDLVKGIVGLLTGGAGDKIGNAVAKGAELIALLGVLGTGVVWLRANSNEVLATITYGDIAVWGPIVGGLLYIIARLVRIPQ